MALIYKRFMLVSGTYLPLHDTEWLPLDPSVILDPLFILDIMPYNLDFVGILH